MIANTPATAPPSLDQILATIRNAIGSLPEPAKTDTLNSLRWLEPAIEVEIDAAITALARKIPVAGTLIGSAVTKSVNAALEAGLVAVIGPLTSTPAAE